MIYVFSKIFFIHNFILHNVRVNRNYHSKDSMCESLAWISRLGRKSSLEIPSKHFLRWGCTRSGSLVSDRISSISSLDKKKNLAATFGAKPLIWYVKNDLEKTAFESFCKYFRLPWEKQALLLQICIQPFHDVVQEVVRILQFL